MAEARRRASRWRREPAECEDLGEAVWTAWGGVGPGKSTGQEGGANESQGRGFDPLLGRKGEGGSYGIVGIKMRK